MLFREKFRVILVRRLNHLEDTFVFNVVVGELVSWKTDQVQYGFLVYLYVLNIGSYLHEDKGVLKMVGSTYEDDAEFPRKDHQYHHAQQPPQIKSASVA